MPIKFIKIKDENNEFDISNVTFEIPNNEIGLSELVGEFEDFLKACGYSFKGFLDFVEDEL